LGTIRISLIPGARDGREAVIILHPIDINVSIKIGLALVLEVYAAGAAVKSRRINSLVLWRKIR
jgi:hypothetical protein